MRVLAALGLLVACTGPAQPGIAETRTYARMGGSADAFNPTQFALALDAAQGRTGTVCRVIDTSTVTVTHPQLTATDDAVVNAALAAYVYNPLFGFSADQLVLHDMIPTLRAWAQDARDEVAAWDTQTQAQRNAAVKVTIDRLGTIMDRLADFLRASGVNGS